MNAWTVTKKSTTTEKLSLIHISNEEVCKERVAIRQKYKNVPIPNHRHEYIELSFMMEGELSVQIEGKEIRMKSGDICLMTVSYTHLHRN